GACITPSSDTNDDAITFLFVAIFVECAQPPNAADQRRDAPACSEPIYPYRARCICLLCGWFATLSLR
ncbi:MAG: hypothetical protein ACKVVP_20130, partial [Chloroflexota bacterium]